MTSPILDLKVTGAEEGQQTQPRKEDNVIIWLLPKTPLSNMSFVLDNFSINTKVLSPTINL